MSDPPRCPTCGTLLTPSGCPTCEARSATRLFRRQLGTLTALILTAVVMFVFTRNTAANLRETRAREAATQYGRGEEALENGDLPTALTYLRQARGNSPETLLYTLTLTRALTESNLRDEARPILLQAREQEPEHPEINLQLARLAGSQEDASAAIRYYQRALYGVWPPGQEERQRSVRLELVRFLLDRDDSNAARAELLVLARISPNDPATHTRLGELFLEAEAPGEAWPRFEAAIRLDEQHEPALAGAGEALFELGEYAQALPYLESALTLQGEGADPRTARFFNVASLVLSSDPLAPRLRAAARESRLDSLIDYARTRLQSCPFAPSWDILWPELEATQAELRQPRARRDPDVLERSFELILSIEENVTTICPTEDVLSEALTRIGSRYRVTDTES